MIKALLVSTECYPFAKAGGMGDVVGALPKYLKAHDVEASVILPVYDRPLFDQKHKVVFSGIVRFPSGEMTFDIRRYAHSSFPCFGVHCPDLFYRENIYLAENGHGYPDEIQRNIMFQRAVLTWWSQQPKLFDIVHCHDHMTGLIPFLIQYGSEYRALAHKPSFFTVHNAIYRGRMPWSFSGYLGHYDEWKWGLLDWSGQIDSLASALRCADKVNVVSPQYLIELIHSGHELEWVFKEYPERFIGLLNGVDYEVWNPETDEYIDYPKTKGISDFKARNKKALTEGFNQKDLPLFCFIGRFAHQKGVDILVESIDSFLENGGSANFSILGSGDKGLEEQVFLLTEKYPENVFLEKGYNEPYSHQLYAGSDFLVMPSREEPCGLNQMFAMRYGSIPVVHATGGLVDTVPDISEGGNGISFGNLSHSGLVAAFQRACTLYEDKKALSKLRNKIIQLDFSWEQAAGRYTEEYIKLIEGE